MTSGQVTISASPSHRLSDITMPPRAQEQSSRASGIRRARQRQDPATERIAEDREPIKSGIPGNSLRDHAGAGRASPLCALSVAAEQVAEEGRDAIEQFRPGGDDEFREMAGSLRGFDGQNDYQWYYQERKNQFSHQAH
jgi:hypothetical protein